METNTSAPYAAVTERYPVRLLMPGDRFQATPERRVEVIERVFHGGLDWNNTRKTAVRVRSLRTGRPLARVVPDTERASGVELLADRPRPETLTLDFFSGGSGGDRDGLSPLEVPLTLGGNVYLKPSFVPAGCMRSNGEITARKTFYKMEAHVLTTGTEGDLALIGQRPYDLWGSKQWDVLGTRLRSIGLLDGGLSAAGLALLEIADRVLVVEPEDAWFTALSAATGITIPPEAIPALSVAATSWNGSPYDLLTAVAVAVTA